MRLSYRVEMNSLAIVTHMTSTFSEGAKMSLVMSHSIKPDVSGIHEACKGIPLSMAVAVFDRNQFELPCCVRLKLLTEMKLSK